MFFNVFLDFKYAIGFFEVVGVSDGLSFWLIFRLENHILDSAEFDDISWLLIKN